MHKYLTLIDDIKEMMVMMSSLPTCTIVFDKDAKLIDINQLAVDFLKIENKNDYLGGTSKIQTDYFYLKRVIETLQTGKTISNGNMKFIKTDNNIVQVKFNACMLYGTKTIFMIQFFEIKSSAMIDFPVLLNSVFLDIQNLQTNLNELGANILTGVKADSNINDSFKESHTVQLLSIRYTSLTQKELAICELISQQVQVQQIAEVFHKTKSHIYIVLKGIIQKLNLESTKELYLHLKEFK